MAQIGRAPFALALQAAMVEGQQRGVPVNMPAVAQGIQAIVEGLYQKGWRFTVDDSNPLFQTLVQQYPMDVSQVRMRGAGGNGNGQQYPQQIPQAPLYPAPQYQMPQPRPAPQPVPQYYSPQQPGPEQFQQQAPPAQVPYQQPVAPSAIVPGQPLPAMGSPGAAGGMKPAATGPVPVQAPVMKSAHEADAPPSLTDAPQPPAPIFE